MAIYRIIEHRLVEQRLREWRWRVARIFWLLAFTILVNTIVLAALDKSTDSLPHALLTALWNSVNLVTTLGDFSVFDWRQKLFMMGAMVCVMVIGAYALTDLTGVLASADVVAYRENRSMQQPLDRLAGHIVVIGFVDLGQLLVDRLSAAARDVVVIDRNERNAARAAELGCLVIKGDAGLDDEVLKHARIDTADTLFVTTADPNRNLSITLMAHTLNDKLKIVVSASNPRWEELLRRAGATEVIVADQLLADAMVGRLG